MRDEPEETDREDSDESVEKMMQHLDDAREMRQASKRRAQYIEDLPQGWPEWFVNQEPDGWDAGWRTTIRNTYLHVTRDDWTIGHNFGGDKKLKTSDLCAYWVFRVREDLIEDQEVSHSLSVTGENDALLSSFRDSFYTEKTQRELKKSLDELNTHSRKEIQSHDWREFLEYKNLVTGTWKFREDELDSFEETVVEAFEDLQPIFNLVTKSMPE